MPGLLLWADRSDVVSGTAEIFFRRVKFWEGDAPPVFVRMDPVAFWRGILPRPRSILLESRYELGFFPWQNIDGINFLYVKRNGLFLVTTTKFNVSPSFTLELLERLATVFKDYCGVLSEESIRKNFVLIYELLDEMLDYGYPQHTSADALKTCVHTEPVVVAPPPSRGFRMGQGKTAPSTAVQRPLSLSTGRTGKKNEIFVDILERITVLFNSGGYLLNSTIDGSIQMKSYLSGNPPLHLALNEDLVIGKEQGAGAYGAVVLDDANFHECVNLDEFESAGILRLVPPDGEFVVMNYRVTGEFRAPFRVFPFIEEQSPYCIDYVLKVRADIPSRNFGSHVTVRFPVPRTAGSVTPEVTSAPGGGAGGAGGGGGGGAGGVVSSLMRGGGGGGAGAGGRGHVVEYDEKEREVVWNIRKFEGGSEHTLRTRITFTQAAGPTVRKSLGPVSMSFEIPMYNVSNLQVRYLRISEAARSYKPHRWVRYVTTSNSYVVRL